MAYLYLFITWRDLYLPIQKWYVVNYTDIEIEYTEGKDIIDVTRFISLFLCYFNGLKTASQKTFTCPKSIIETIEKDVKYVQS